MKLAKTFESLSLESAEAGEGDSEAGQAAEDLKDRAGLYYRASLLGLSKVERGSEPDREPTLRLLQSAGPTPGQQEMDKMRETANLFLACQTMQTGQHTEAIAAFRQLRSPYASYYTGETFKKLAADERERAGLGEAGVAGRELLVEAREALYLTLDRLRGLGGAAHPLDSQLAESIEEVESLLGSVGEEGESSPVRGPPPARALLAQLTSTPHMSRTLFEGTSGSPGRVEARPSPERLDAQMRQLTGELSRTTSQLARTVSQVESGGDMSRVVEVTREVLDSNNKILTEIKEIKTNLMPIISDIYNELRELRRDAHSKEGKMLEALTKITENTAVVSSNAAASKPELSDEEKLLLESFGVGGQLQVPAATTALLLQQQLLQQQLVRQPGLVPGLGYLGYPATPLFNPLAAGPEAQTHGSISQQLSQLVPGPAPVAAPSPVKAVAPVPVISTPAPVIKPVQEAAAVPSRPAAKAAPANVVISVSDPIPLTAPATTSPMTVTVPPEHRLGSLSNSPRGSAITAPATLGTTPHSYQIKMPAGAAPLTVSPFKSGEDPAVSITTQSLLSSIPNPVFSAVTPSPEKPASTTVTKTRVASGSNPVSRPAAENGAAEDPEQYEPAVDFAPVIPLPEVVEVVTGEEEESILFEDRAKLFRFYDDSKEWKERGLGQAKILKNKASGKVRFLMRREQTFKVCANHQIIPVMKLDKMSSNARARIWAAQDFSDEEMRTEKFCIKFKTEEQADKFEQSFLEAVEASTASCSPVKETKQTAEPALATQTDEEEVAKLKEAAKPAAPVVTIGAGGGFKFGGPVATPTTTTTTASALSGGFSFGNPNSTNAVPGSGAALFQLNFYRIVLLVQQK